MATYDLLQRHNQVRGDQHRIDINFRHSRMPPFAFYCNIDFVGTGHVHARTEAHFTGRQHREHVLPYNARRLRILQHAFFDHDGRPSRKLLFARLKDKLYRSFELVAQLLKISTAYSPPPPEGFISPMLWGVESQVVERFGAAGIPPERIACVKDTYVFNFPGPPAEFVDAFRRYYGPTMNAFDAAEKAGRADDLRRELVDLFTTQNTRRDGQTSIPATFLRVTVSV